MRKMDIRELLNRPESKTLEFKQDLSSLQPIIKTIVAFANTAGGILVVGGSPEGTLVGLEDVLSAEEKMANVIAENVCPPILPEIEITTVNGKNLLIVRVAFGRGPFYVKRLGKPGGVYIRLGSTSRPSGPELLEELERTTLNVSYDQQPVAELNIDHLDSDRISEFFRLIKRGSDQQKLLSMGITVPMEDRIVPSIGGLILFGKDEVRSRLVSDARVSCARFVGTDKVDILDRYDVNGTILDAIEEVPKFIARNTRLAAEIKTMRRKDIPEYSPVAIREVLINALVHADYSLIGSRIQVAIFSDRLEIQNPGMLPFGYTMESFRIGVSKARNKVLARVFREMEFIEEWGSGYRRISKACESGGYSLPKWQEIGAMMRVTFRPHPATQLEEVRTSMGTAFSPSRRREAIMKLFELRETMTLSEVGKLLSLDITPRTLRYDLGRLKAEGKLICEGRGPGAIWRKIQ